MTTPNHILGGIAFTGIIGSLAGLNILSSPAVLTTTIIASIWPDIDHPKSLIGRILYPIAQWINRHYGHRTITHSLAMLILFYLMFYGLCQLFNWPTTNAHVFCIAYTSHLLLDMMTVQGVPLFYPFLRNPCVLPGNPELRFTTGNIRSETILFCLFTCSLVFLHPLMKSGFWTQYNRLFGTPKHLASQIKKSPTAVWTRYQYKRGSQLIQSEGYAIEVNSKEVVLLEDGQWLKIPLKDIVKVIPESSQQKLLIHRQEFRFLSPDSLNQLLRGKQLQHIEVLSETAFVVQHGLAKNSSRHFIADYAHPIFSTPPATPLVNTPLRILPNPKIQTLEFKIKRLEKEHQDKWSAFEKNQQEKVQILQQIESANTDLYQKETALKKLKEFKEITSPSSIDEEIQIIQSQINLLKEKDAFNLQQKQEAQQQKIQHSQIAPPLLSGHFSYVEIQ